MAHKNKQNRSPWKDRQKSRGGSKKPLLGKHRKIEKVFDFQEANDRIYDIFNHHGFADFPHDQRLKLTEFYQVLMQAQTHRNFTRLTKLRDVAIKHFIDSLMVMRLTKLQFPLLDMGTGPGFPGVPLKIALPNERILLAEGVQNRVAFLKEVREKLELEGLDIIGRNVTQEFEYPVQGVITRAVEDIGNTLKNVAVCLQTGGCVYLMKGPNVDPEIAPAEKEWGEYYELIQDEAYNLPETPHERRLLVYKKLKPFIPEDRDDF